MLPITPHNSYSPRKFCSPNFFKKLIQFPFLFFKNCGSSYSFNFRSRNGRSSNQHQ
jgi:hypothetical protein